MDVMFKPRRQPAIWEVVALVALGVTFIAYGALTLALSSPEALYVQTGARTFSWTVGTWAAIGVSAGVLSLGAAAWAAYWHRRWER